MKADVVIVGSGIAAVAVARRILGRRPATSIVVLEAGRQVKMRDFAVYQDYLVSGNLPYTGYYDLPAPSGGQPGENQLTGSPQMTLAGTRLMMFGGTTVHWDGYSFRLKPEDFRLHSNTGHGIDWPITYDDLEPYYGQAERFIGVSGDSADTSVPRSTGFPFQAFPYTLEDTFAIQAFNQLGLSFSHLPIARNGLPNGESNKPPCQTTGSCLYCPFGARYNAANDMADLLETSTLTLRTDAVVERVLVDGRRRARGVEYLDRVSGKRTVVEADTVVIAGGTIESPKLLQRSTSEFWKNGIGNDLGLVGRNIVTHPWINYQAAVPANRLRLQPEMAFPTLVSRHYDSVAEQPCGKFVMINPNTSPNNINLAKAMQEGRSRREIDAMVDGPMVVEMNTLFEIFSRPEYRVSNLNGTNRIGLPQTLVNFGQTPLVAQRVSEVLAKVTEVMRAMGAVGEVTLEDGCPDFGAHHACCTTRMSDSPELGVVDANLRVHETDNLYVCSNASFSTLSSVNPTLTLAALSLRLGDRLLAQFAGTRS